MSERGTRIWIEDIRIDQTGRSGEDRENVTRQRTLDAKMRQHLDAKHYQEWAENQEKPWAKVVAKIPFGTYRIPSVTLRQVEKHFNKRIAGRQAEKSEIMRSVASFMVNGRFRRPLLFVGPPGEGKSHFAQCLASSLGYPIKYINVPSLNSPVALNGSERHYDNSRIGTLLQTVIDEECLSVVFVFDEVDKAVNTSQDGSVEAALLALFDPLWNGKFIDRSVDVPVDLSRCVFICTANDASAISAPLRDRMDIIDFAPYTAEQALEIVETMTIPEVIANSGVKGKIRFEPDVAAEVIRRVRDGSMRDYEKVVEKLVDHAIYSLLTSDRKRYTVTVEDIDRIGVTSKNRTLGFAG